MAIITKKISLETIGNGSMHDLTPQVEQELRSLTIDNGIVTIFCTGSTAAISTVEYEPGLCQDVPKALERIAPKNITYAHNEKWQDGNGRSHVQATLVGPSLTVPFIKKTLTLGTWQQIVLIDCDIHSRKRELILQFMGE